MASPEPRRQKRTAAPDRIVDQETEGEDAWTVEGNLIPIDVEDEDDGSVDLAREYGFTQEEIEEMSKGEGE